MTEAIQDSTRIEWTEDGKSKSAHWHSEAGLTPPSRVVVVDDEIDAGAALRMASESTALLYRGDFHNARQLLSAMSRRIDGRAARDAETAVAIDAQTFHRYRMRQAQRARILGMLLLPFDAGHKIPLRRAPDVSDACNAAWGSSKVPYVATLRELQGAIGAYEWRKKGVEVAALEAKIHPHYGVFAPIRSEYVDLVADAQMPDPLPKVAFDIGTGTGVLAAVLARRGIERVVATDNDPRALRCARDNINRLRLASVVTIDDADLFPESTADLIVCNPPWLPGKATSTLERAIYDTDQHMLRGFIGGLGTHLAPGGEGWLVMSDLAEHLGLRKREDLLAMFAEAGLVVKDRHETKPFHPRANDRSDTLHAARSREITSLWRLSNAG